MPIGDCFIEVVSPTQEGTAAGRYLQRRGGDGGYMVMFDVEDLSAARSRARAMGLRVVWEIDLPDISGTHLHPSDIEGAIVSIDQPTPPGSWRWAGPAWTGQAHAGPPGRLLGATLAVADPAAVAERWGRLLGISPHAQDDGRSLALDGGSVEFVAAGSESGLIEVALQQAEELRRGEDELTIGGLTFRLLLDS